MIGYRQGGLFTQQRSLYRNRGGILKWAHLECIWAEHAMVEQACRDMLGREIRDERAR